jgi:hypothetical protein
MTVSSAFVLHITLVSLVIVKSSTFQLSSQSLQILVQTSPSTRREIFQSLPIDYFVLPAVNGLQYITCINQKERCGVVRHISDREMNQKDNSPVSFTLWEVPSSWRNVIGDSISSSNEAFCFCGDSLFAVYAIQNLAPLGGTCLWKPISLVSDIDVFRLRSAGICGLVEFLLDKDDSTLVPLFRRLKRPCSAIDYPPVIYMIGEDEINEGGD